MKELKGIDENALPERWCVKRTPENAEVLQAWRMATFNDKQYWSRYGHTDLDYLHSINGIVWDSVRAGYTEITFEQWQTIPEIAEWIKEWNMGYFRNISEIKESTEKMEEREIIGYKFKKGLEKRLKESATAFCWPKEEVYWSETNDYLFQPKSVIYDMVEDGQVWHWFEPVYADEFKVGEYATFKGKETFKISKITDDYLHADGETGYAKECCTVATTEEIEAARPKRKYMKQVFIISYRDAENYRTIANVPCDSKEEANNWILENSVQGCIYEIKTFEVVAYENLRLNDK